MSFEPLPKLIGHRGASASAPENTLAALRKAQEGGAGWVEFDVKLTADGIPILMHDDKLNRTTNGKGKVAKTTFEDLQKLDAGAWFDPVFAGERVPSLHAALEQCAELGLGVNIELKPCPGRAEATAKAALAAIDEVWPATMPAPLFSSFDPSSLAAVQAQRPEAHRGFLCTRPPRTWLAQMNELGCRTLHVSHHWIRQKHIDAARQRDIPLLAYTVNDAVKAAKLIQAGVTAVFTDQVQAVAEQLNIHTAAA